MERALDLDLLTNTLGSHSQLPSPSELQTLLTQAEIGLFTLAGQVPENLLDAAWYLHAIASSRPDLDIYPLPRRRRAYQVSAHIFDIFLAQRDIAEPLPFLERLRFTFAAQIGYLGGELVPNATAMALRGLPSPFEAADPLTSPGSVALQAGILMLALNRAELFRQLPRWRTRFEELSATFGDIDSSPLGASQAVVRGCLDLLLFLVDGRLDLRASAEDSFLRAMRSPGSTGDLDSRWVATHLLGLTGDLAESSVWAVLGPDLSSAARAMTLSDPGVLTLWPPQLKFLRLQPSPLEPATRRLVMSFPTSAGKTLLAQLVVLAQLSSGPGDACIVAPTHSLCREIKGALERRLSVLGGTAVDAGPLGWATAIPTSARVVVTTPEKLAALIRADPAALLTRFCLFVVDEAHLVGEGERGWRLEETLSFLHHATRQSHHRIVVLSAALGNQAHVVSWLDAGQGVVSTHDDWRGPRRLHAIYATRLRMTERTVAPPVGQRARRRSTPILGQVHLRGPNDTVHSGQFREPVGTLVERQKRDGSWTPDDSSTRQRSQLVPLVSHLATSGPVLIVWGTRLEARQFAQELAEDLDDSPATQFLAELIESRVGTQHPLGPVLRKGVAYHHSTLPSDVQAEIEDAARLGKLKVLVSTSTLTEGVNLPFKTVVIASRGYRSSDGWVEVIDPPRLLNAVGRAGRACRETEGWLVLVIHETFKKSLFRPLDITAQDLDLQSTLCLPSALEALVAFEAVLAAGEDAAFTSTGDATDSFCSYVWFLATAIAELQGAATRSDVLSAIESTFAFQQLSEDLRLRWRNVATASMESYDGHEAPVRRRWSKSGTSLPSAQILDGLAAGIVADIGAGAMPTSVIETLEMMLGNGRLEILLAMRENRARPFKRILSDPITRAIDVDILELLRDWVSGIDLDEIGERHLGVVSDTDYRAEQLSEFVSSVFEHFLPWTVGILVTWVNERLVQTSVSLTLPESVPGHIHFGVESYEALVLMAGGIRSRRFAIRVAEIFAASGEFGDIRDWIASVDLVWLRDETGALPTELADMLIFVRAPAARLVADVVSGGVGSIPIVLPTTEGAAEYAGVVEVAPEVGEPEPANLLVSAEGSAVGRIATNYYNHVLQLLLLGVPLRFTVTPAEPGVLSVTRVDIE